ncbi:MAG: tRNA (adenosine(37)-N6)-dimethylallyltransferase MiaA [Clostridia bacterium]|nr:tRNA (adenosine(37)-N6)-dimethylallyltransferase MiaA [Clostridia bacterium]
MQNICAIAGPTASGKTALAVELALRLGGEVVSFDSMQVYTDLAVGTAKPDMDERRGVPHHLFDLLPPGEDFSCSDFCKSARPVIREITDRGRLPILCGGTGLYLDSLLQGEGLSAAGADESIRQKYNAMAEAEGVDAVHAALAAVDPDSAAAIHKNNVKRVIRALEIYELTGITKTEWDLRSKQITGDYNAAVLVLTFRDRELLYDRIEHRVDIMMESGIVEEAEMLYKAGVLHSGKGVSQAIGYKEFIPYFEGTRTLAEVRDDIVLATRHYAKRQITWFSRRGEECAIYVDEGGAVRSLADIADEAETRIKKMLTPHS